MKIIGYILLYITLTIGYYLLLSSIGCLFFDNDGHHYSYTYCVGNINWFIGYIMLIHWWLVIFSLFEYYNKYIKNLEI